MLLETSTLPIHGKYGTVQVEGPRCVVFFEEEFDKSAGLWDCRWELYAFVLQITCLCDYKTSITSSNAHTLVKGLSMSRSRVLNSGMELVLKILYYEYKHFFINLFIMVIVNYIFTYHCKIICLFFNIIIIICTSV